MTLMRFEVAQHLTADAQHTEEGDMVIMWGEKHHSYSSKPMGVTKIWCLQHQTFHSTMNARKHFFLYRTGSAYSNRCTLQTTICIQHPAFTEVKLFCPNLGDSIAPSSSNRQKYFQRTTFHSTVGAEHSCSVCSLLFSLYRFLLYYITSYRGIFSSQVARKKSYL